MLTIDPLYLRGLSLFDREEFYESHEVLEELWKLTSGPSRLFIQALIHFAVAFYHQQQTNQTGAKRQLQKALRKLAGFLPLYQSIDTAALYREGLNALDRVSRGELLEQYLKIGAFRNPF
ncbi:MAG: DUF309 domain-containing protein [Bryobacteraceae bacterium]